MTAQMLSGRRAWWLAGFFLLLLNSAYLGAFATASAFYYAQVVAHVVGGAVLGATALRFLVRHRTMPEGWGVAAGPLLVALATGLALAWTGATRPWRWLLYTHIAASVLGALAVLLSMVVRGGGRLDRRLGSGGRVRAARPSAPLPTTGACGPRRCCRWWRWSGRLRT